MTISYNDPLIIEWNNTLVEITEDITIVNQQAILKQIPDAYQHVQITKQDGTIMSEIRAEGIIGDNQFYVDYNVGFVYFSSNTLDGTVVTSHYYGRGIIKYPASRIYNHGSNPDVIQNLQEIIDNGQNGINALNELGNFKHVGDYNSTTAYYKHNIVRYQTASYICVDDGGSSITGIAPTDTIYWKQLSSFNFKDMYSSIIAYETGDYVIDSNNHNLYMCLVSSTGIALTDTTTWAKIISVDDLVQSVNTAVSNAEIATINANNATNSANTATSNANVATTNANNAATNAQIVVDNTHYIEPWLSTTTYSKNNIVSYNGSSFISLVDSNLNNIPNSAQDTVYWGVLARKGVDGQGAVNTVNNLSPDINGNISITANDVSAPLLRSEMIPNLSSINVDGMSISNFYIPLRPIILGTVTLQ